MLKNEWTEISHPREAKEQWGIYHIKHAHYEQNYLQNRVYNLQTEAEIIMASSKSSVKS